MEIRFSQIQEVDLQRIAQSLVYEYQAHGYEAQQTAAVGVVTQYNVVHDILNFIDQQIWQQQLYVQLGVLLRTSRSI